MNIINKPIAMVTHTDVKGVIKPVRFRIEDSGGESRTIHIKRVIHVTEYKIGATKELVRKFICEIEYNDVKRQCEIEYNLNNTKWTLVKM